MNTEDRFTPRSPLTPERMRAYLDGRLSPAEAHEVELHMEDSLLHREAMEGLSSVPGADPAALHRHRPRSGHLRLLLSAIVLLFIIGLPLRLLLLDKEPSMDDTPDEALSPSPHTSPALAERALDAELDQVLETAVELPESLQLGHGRNERHVRDSGDPSTAVAREPVTERLEVRSLPVDGLRQRKEAGPLRGDRPSRELYFLHDLKLVHPNELYTRDPGMAVEPGGTPADKSTLGDRAEDERMYVRYLAFMEQALGHFARNDHRRCLEDMRFLLKQYPDDVNALFYAGLSSYNLGLHERACAYFERAAEHEVDSFNEEAAWYHAHCFERLHGHTEARSLFQAIAGRKGFYAERAARHLADR